MNKDLTLEREALLKQLEDLYCKLAENQRRIKELESQLPLEEQLRLNVNRVLQVSFPALAGKARVEIVPLTPNSKNRS